MKIPEMTMLTSYSTCYGCASKVGPVDLKEILDSLRLPVAPPELLVGLETPDDAAVYKINEEQALVQTVDFFTPMVDDPYVFGAIAAANSLSDIYAMGGRPLTALSVAGFPEDLSTDTVRAVLQGGADKISEAGAAMTGGHTMMNKEPFFGFSVTGMVHPGRVLRKAQAKPGDRLFLTKPLGTGVVVTAHERGIAEEEHLQAAVDSMSRLNKRASEVLEGAGVRSVTDVTGFGLIGHARELAQQSGVALRFELDAIPFISGVLDYAYQEVFPCRLRRNRDYLIDEGYVRIAPGLELPQVTVLFDPQTSGGLLFTASPNVAAGIPGRFEAAGEPVWEIGVAEAGSGISIE